MFSVVFCTICWFLITIINLYNAKYCFKTNKFIGIPNLIVTFMTFTVFLLYLFTFIASKRSNL